MSGYDSDLQYLDGPRLVLWLNERFPQYEGHFYEFHDSLGRRIREWERGERASVYSADHWLIKLGAHPSELPDDLFLPDNHRKNQVYLTYEEKKAAVARVRAGELPSKVAASLNVAQRTLNNWTRGRRMRPANNLSPRQA